MTETISGRDLLLSIDWEAAPEFPCTWRSRPACTREAVSHLMVEPDCRCSPRNLCLPHKEMLKATIAEYEARGYRVRFECLDCHRSDMLIRGWQPLRG